MSSRADGEFTRTIMYLPLTSVVQGATSLHINSFHLPIVNTSKTEPLVFFSDFRLLQNEWKEPHTIFLVETCTDRYGDVVFLN